MQTYIAHYRSPAGADKRGAGLFEFESASRAGSKANLRDARLRMLELFGRDAVSWTIERTELKRTAAPAADGQLELDFRPPKAERARRTRKTWW